MSDAGQLFDPQAYGAPSKRATRRAAPVGRAVDVTRDWIVLRHLKASPLAHLRKGDGLPNGDGAVRAECGAVALPLAGVPRLVACDACVRKALDRGLLLA